MRSRLQPLILAVCWSALSSACWSDGPAPRTTTPTAVALADPTGGNPPSSGIRFISRAPNRCARAIAHLFEQSRSDIASSGMSEAFIQELQDAAVASCEETQWSAESLDCYEDTSSRSDISACISGMTMEQQEDFKRRMTELLQRQSSYPSPPPPPPPP